MTNMQRGAAVVMLSAAVGGWTGVARANHFTDACASELNAVETAIESGVFLGKNASTDQSNLLAKLEAAAAKISLTKYDDAVDKLQNISDTATALADAPKQKLEDASGINAAVVIAIDCVGGL
ncbi:MAG: hypothetical protein ACM3IK_01780 [Sphingomonadaceae bacterium]